MQLDKEQAKQVGEMMGTPGWAVLQSVVSEIKDKMSSRVAPLARDMSIPAEKILAMQNYTLGQIVGMGMFMGTPDKILNDLEELCAEEKENK